ncbi:SRPBCC family protein [Nocardioides stalactiti]|uniref:SRPBCC family protein n=1 Tax=Nocardioides stalactiti TaxID=2755356 RepID=UPI0016039E1C|nr:SRPBCC family protein [Nocardioides stalactiti]
MPVLVSASGPASVDEAWARYSRPSAWPTWAPQITRVATDRAVLEPGLRGVVHGPLFVRVPFRVGEVDHGAHRWSWRVGVGAAAVHMEHGVDPEGSGSTAWVRIHLPWLVCFPYLPVARWALRGLVTSTAECRPGSAL